MRNPSRNTLPRSMAHGTQLHNKIYGQDDDTSMVYKFVGVTPFALTGYYLLGLEKPFSINYHASELLIARIMIHDGSQSKITF